MFGSNKKDKSEPGDGMVIVYMLINELIPADYNPRRISDKQMEALKESMARLGTLEPAVINMHPTRKKVIISGHQRIKAAESMGDEDYPCYQVEFTIEQEKEANIRMNQNGGEWDFDLLKDNFELDDLKDFGFDDLKFNPDIPGGGGGPLTHTKSKVIICPHCTKEIEMVKGKPKAQEMEEEARPKMSQKENVPLEAKHYINWEFNQAQIATAYVKLIARYNRRPTIRAVARETGFAINTVHTHIKELQKKSFEDRFDNFKVLSERLLMSLYSNGMAGKTSAAKLYFQIVENWKPGLKIEIESEGNLSGLSNQELLEQEEQNANDINRKLLPFSDADSTSRKTG